MVAGGSEDVMNPAPIYGAIKIQAMSIKKHEHAS